MQNEIYNKKIELTMERKKLTEQLNLNTHSLLNLQMKCPHALVLKFDDNKMHKLGKIYNYFCPACGKWEMSYYAHEFEQPFLKKAIIIDLTAYPKNIFYDHIQDICNYLFDNYDYYYNYQIDVKEKAYSIIEFMQIEGQKIYKK